MNLFFIKVNENGIISFTQAFDGFAVDPFPNPSGVPLVSPFNSDIDGEDGVGIFYR